MTFSIWKKALFLELSSAQTRKDTQKFFLGNLVLFIFFISLNPFPSSGVKRWTPLVIYDEYLISRLDQNSWYGLDIAVETISMRHSQPLVHANDAHHEAAQVDMIENESESVLLLEVAQQNAPRTVFNALNLLFVNTPKITIGRIHPAALVPIISPEVVTSSSTFPAYILFMDNTDPKAVAVYPGAHPSATEVVEWLLAQFSARALSYLKNIFKDERCVVMGNGPSLNRMPELSDFLKKENIFAFNKIYMGFDRFNFTPSVYVAVNPLVIEQSAVDIINSVPSVRFLSLKNSVSTLPQLLPHVGLGRTAADHGIYFLKPYTGPADRRFALDPAAEGVHEGWTVTHTGLQLAYHAGCDPVVLIGVDHSFRQDSAPNEKAYQEGEDPNHFDPGYFKNQEWHAADLRESERSYARAREVYEASGRSVIDATVDGRLHIFKKQHYRDVFLKGE